MKEIRKNFYIRKVGKHFACMCESQLYNITIVCVGVGVGVGAATLRRGNSGGRPSRGFTQYCVNRHARSFAT